jgi:hypothetical protein
MARQVDIENGVEKAAAALEGRQRAEMSTQWRELRNKLDTMLLSTNVMKTNDVRQRCLELDGMTTEERRNHIRAFWGPIYLDRTDPILAQLQSLESNIAKHE